MGKFLILSTIETDDDKPMTIDDIKRKISDDLNRGEGLYLDIDAECTIRAIKAC